MRGKNRPPLLRRQSQTVVGFGAQVGVPLALFGTMRVSPQARAMIRSRSCASHLHSSFLPSLKILLNSRLSSATLPLAPAPSSLTCAIPQVPQLFS